MDARDVHQFEAAGDVAALIAALTAPEPRVRQEACYALGQLERAETTADVAERLANDDHESVRAAAAEVLGWLRRADVVPQLILALQEDPDDDVRARAAGALGAIGDPAAVPALDAAARQPGAAAHSGLHRESQIEAIRALGMLVPDPAARSVLRALEQGGGQIGLAARRALLPVIVWGVYHQQALRHLVKEARWSQSGWLVAAELRADPDNAYDDDAVRVVAVADAVTIGYLRKDYAADLSPTLRVEGPLPCTVEISGGHRLNAFMVTCGNEPDEAAALAAAAAAAAQPAQTGDPLRNEAVAHLAACVSAEMTVVCLRHLGGVSGAKDAGLVLDYLRRPEAAVRAAAVEVLGEWRAAEAAEALAALQDDPSAEVREAAAKALARVAAPEA
jgi:HEAT repeat protein